MATNGIYAVDINVPSSELRQALKEAGISPAMDHVKPEISTYNARDIINFKITFGL